MSVKAMGLVWDMECPAKINGKEFKPSHKFVLIAYADHADHNGKNIWPAIETIAKKTGLDTRTVQRLTKDMREMGYLVEDGKGPRGTNRWALPFSNKGDKLSPLTGDILTPDKLSGDKTDKSLGDNSLGDIPLNDKLTPEFKELNQELINNISNDVFDSWENMKERVKPDFQKAQYETWIAPTQGISFDDLTLNVATINDYARQWLDENLKELAQTHLGVYVKFITVETARERMPHLFEQETK